jgi:hypothetical protein
MTSTGSSSTAPDTDPAAGQADVLIGIPACNQERTIDAALEAARGSVLGPLTGVNTAIVLMDGGSTDRTRERAAAVLGDLPGFASLAYTGPGDVLSVPFHGLPGRPHALAALFEAARSRGAKACVLLDAAAAGLSVEGLARLARAVLDEGYDFAAASYLRPAYAGALSKSIVAPAFRACYGIGLSQPMAGEFACSTGLVGHCLDPDVAIETADPVGVNLRLAITATTGAFRACEVVVGVRSGASREDGLDLSTTLAQVVGALFSELERTASVWHRVRRSVAPPIFGPVAGDVPAAHPVPDVAPLVEAFRLGYRELRELWSEILPPSSILALKRLAAVPEGEFKIDHAFWARTIYDFALAHRLRGVARDQLLRSLTPLYLGWLASFIVAIRHIQAAGVDERLGQVSAAFEAEKPYLISGWRWPERFGPARNRR